MSSDVEEIRDLLIRTYLPLLERFAERVTGLTGRIRIKIDKPRGPVPLITYGEYSAVWAVPPGREDAHKGLAWFCCQCSGSGSGTESGEIDGVIDDHLGSHHPGTRFQVIELGYLEGEISVLSESERGASSR